MGIFRARSIFIALSALGAIWLGWLVANEYALSYASQHYLANGVVRIELPGGRKFDIPERYMYWEGYVKHGRWPKPKEGRVKVESFNFDALLPDLRPYRAEDDEKWQELGYGDKLHVYVHRKDFDATSWRHVYESELDSVERGYAKRLDNENGLAKFLNLIGKEGDLKPYDVTYFTEDFKILIRCSYPGRDPFPSCNVRFIDENKYNYLNYYYSIAYFRDWNNIHKNLISLIAQFERDGNSDSIK
ncbi:hypothetical protein [Sinorhizobium prairiense]|uniref:hypothetical protein n=1 Tax=unclassified Sinorhizobium TaxID=2613772 RepID=UPI0023D7CE9E|nr:MULTISPECIES: hypothetical protein [unclassified Sinorhizobium]WEJ14241.1 hypothetical protein N0Q91_11640 [Sinorhizobium sp. K101]WEJ38144.1 hypothetical protein N0R80_08655 [Sinorhizobium sp. C101]